MLKTLVKHQILKLSTRNIHTVTPNAKDILLYGKNKYNKAISDTLNVDVNTNCYKCYELMTNNHLNYLRVVENEETIGILKRSDVKEVMLYHEYETKWWLYTRSF